MVAGQQPNLWDTVRAWADSVGLLLPEDPDRPAREAVPQEVCDSCPICQAAATADRLNPDAVADLVDMARDVVSGLASAMASAASHRDEGSRHASRADDGPGVDHVGPGGAGPQGADPDHGGDRGGDRPTSTPRDGSGEGISGED